MSQKSRLSQFTAAIILALYGLTLVTQLFVPAMGPADLGHGTPLSWLIQFALFLPIGLIAPLAFGRHRPRARILTVGGVLVFSAVIEIARDLFLGRDGSVADALARPLGVLLGILLLALIDQWRTPEELRAGAHVARRVQAEWDYFRFVYKDETNMLWGLSGVALTFLILPEPWSTYMLVVTLVITCALLLVEIYGVFQKWSQAKFEKRAGMTKASPSRFADALKKDPKTGVDGHAASAASWGTRTPYLATTTICDDPTRTEVWYDGDVDSELRRQSALSMGDASPASADNGKAPASAYLAGHTYQLPKPLADVSAAALRLDRNSANPIDPSKTRLPIRFNGRVLRLATEPSARMLTADTFQFQRVRYFDGEASNEMWRYVPQGPATTAEQSAPKSPIEPFVLDRNNRMKRLENSEAANIVGISIMALTQDNHLLFVRQSLGNSIAPKALAASGSGSLELIDFHAGLANGQDPAGVLPTAAALARKKSRRHEISARTEVPLVRLLLNGMLREMSEESLITAEQILVSSALVTGYFRWIERAMKPEFVGLVRLNIRSADAAVGKIAQAERAFTTGSVKVPLGASLLAQVAAQQGAYEGIATALQNTLMAHFVAESPEGDAEQLARMSPSCEHACVTALRYLASAEGTAWLERTDLSVAKPRETN